MQELIAFFCYLCYIFFMLFRQATPTDAAFVVPLIYEAYNGFAHFICASLQPSIVQARLTYYFQALLPVVIHYSHFMLLIDETTGQPMATFSTMMGKDIPLLNQNLALQMKVLLPPSPTLQETLSTVKHICEAEPNEFYLDIFAVAKPLRGQGLAPILMAKVEQLAKESTLPSLILFASDDLVAFYQKLGFVFYQKRVAGTKTYNVMQKILG